jgi:ADP-heptose:LPS heptosyltransferase
MKYAFRNKTYISLVRVFDLVGRIFFLPIIKKKYPDNVKRILLIRLDHLGDVVHSLEVAEVLKQYYPQAKITFLVSCNMQSILAKNPFVDEIICYDAPWFARRQKNKKYAEGLIGLTRQLSYGKYDLGIELRGDARQIIIMSLAGIKFKAGYGITGGSFLLELCPQYPGHLTERNKNIKLIEAVLKKAQRIPQSADLATGKKSYEYFPFTTKPELLSKFNLKADKPPILIHPLAGVASRMWSEEKWSNLIRLLADKEEREIIIVDQRGENKNILIDKSRANVINLLDKTNLADLIGLCKIAGLMISCNSGPAHIAYVLNKPLVVIASATNSINNWFEINQNTYVIQKMTSCCDCHSQICPKDKHYCMEEISVEEVLGAVDRLTS